MTDKKRKLKQLIVIALLAEAVEQDEELEQEEFKRQRRRRLIWTREWILRRSRNLKGIIHLAHEELRFEDSDYLSNILQDAS